MLLCNRVSVPRSTTQSVYRLRPHRRKSFDPDDSLSLSKVIMNHLYPVDLRFLF